MSADIIRVKKWIHPASNINIKYRINPVLHVQRTLQKTFKQHYSVHTVYLRLTTSLFTLHITNTVLTCSYKWVWTELTALPHFCLLGTFEFQSSHPQWDITTLPFVLICSWSVQQAPKWTSVSVHYISWHTWPTCHDINSLYSKM